MQIAKEIGFEMKVLDIGGGFPWEYEEKEFDFEKFCAPIREALSKLDSSIQIFAEPGRFMSTTCITLV